MNKTVHLLPSVSRWRAILVVLLANVLYLTDAGAFHIIGGELTYRCTGQPSEDLRDFRFTMDVYRDCSADGAAFDDPAEIGVYSLVNGVYTFIRRIDVSRGTISFVPPPENPCLILPENVCVQHTRYVFNLNSLPVINGSYFIFWRRCCRNATITNIINPRDEGATFAVEITSTAQQVCNNSPTFDAFPPTAICLNDFLTFDHSATDSEGDQLVYEFCAPLQGGGPAGGSSGQGDERNCNGIRPNPAMCPPPFPLVTYVTPQYSAVNPLAGSPRVVINANTGIITGTPEIRGQFVVGVCVKEYRNGELLSTLQRDFQFNVAICESAVFAEIEADTTLSGQRYIVNSCGTNTISFNNLSERQDKITSYRWEFDLGSEVQTFDTRNVTVTFPGVGSFAGTLILNEGLSCADTADIAVNVYPSIAADFEYAYDTCYGAPVDFTDLSTTGSGQMTDWEWTFGDGNGSMLTDPEHLYRIPGNHDVTLHVTDINQCEAEITRTIPYFPVPPVIIVEPSTFTGCTPAEVFFNNLSIPIDSTYNIVWDFGDGNQGFDISPTHIYTEPGLYSINISVTSPIGCFISAEFPNWIRVKDSPLAGFSYAPSMPNNFEPTVSFSDESVDAVGWQWRFSDDGAAFIQNPVHTFRDTGIMQVEQVVFHENGCTDTAYAMIDIEPQVRYYLPNAFTPNNDGKNDTYRGVGSLEGMTDFELAVWSRWGELVFETHDPLEGWNGQMRNTDADMPVGVYVCVVNYRNPRGQPVTLEEFATLVR